MLRASYQLLKTCRPHPRCLACMTHPPPSSGPSICSQRLYSLNARYLHQPGDTGYIDVHKDDPAHSRNPADYDVLITDIDEDVLRTKISKKIGILR